MPPLRNTGRPSEAECPEYAGSYLLEEVLGTGGMGVVHLATSASGRRLAVKVIHLEFATDPEFRARFRQEVTAARRVSGAFTAPVVDADPDAGRPWMATLFIDGPTLSERVKRNGPLSVAELVTLGAGLAEGLRDIHRAGVVHRDLKPSNVLLAADGPKVIDFGISRPSDSDLRTETGKLIGTPPYMAPEQFQRPREVGPAADVFALASVLVHAATGRGPFDSDSPYVVAYQVVHNEPDLTGVPPELLPVVSRCLAKDPAERPTPDDLVTALRRTPRAATPFVPAALAPGPQEGSEQPDTHPRGPSAARRPRRRGVRWVALGTAGAALVAAAGFAALHDSGPHPDRPKTGGQAFRPWLVHLPGAATAHRTPECSAAGGAVYCTAPGVAAARLDASDGHVDWTVKDAAARGFVASDTAPRLSGGLLDVVAPGSRRLEVLDAATGHARWSADISARPTVRYTAGAVLLASTDGRTLTSLDDTDGSERWTTRLAAGSSVWTDPGGDGTAVYTTQTNENGTATVVRSLDPATGRVSWQEQVQGTLTPLGATPGAVVLLSQNTDQVTDSVVRVDTATHAVRRFTLPDPVEQTVASLSGGIAYLMSFSGSLIAVDTRDGGGLRWRLETAASRASAPAVSDGHVFVTAGDGRLLAVDAGRGRLLGQTAPRLGGGGSAVTSSLPAPVVTGREVVAGAPDGSVFAVDARRPGSW